MYYILLLYRNLWDRTNSGEFLMIPTLSLLTNKSSKPPTTNFRYDNEICEASMPPKGKEVFYADSPVIEKHSTIINLSQISKFKALGS